MEIISRKEAKQKGLKWYFTGIPCKRGHVCEIKVGNYACKDCAYAATNVWQKQHRVDNLEACNAKARISARNMRINNPVSLLLSSAKRRAKINGLEFNITHSDIQIPSHCPVFGIPLVVGCGTHKQHDDSPSVDRIDNSKGYIRDNVRVISWRANCRKSDMSTAEILALAEYVKRELYL